MRVCAGARGGVGVNVHFNLSGSKCVFIIKSDFEVTED